MGDALSLPAPKPQPPSPQPGQAEEVALEPHDAYEVLGDAKCPAQVTEDSRWPEAPVLQTTAEYQCDKAMALSSNASTCYTPDVVLKSISVFTLPPAWHAPGTASHEILALEKAAMWRFLDLARATGFKMDRDVAAQLFDFIGQTRELIRAPAFRRVVLKKLLECEPAWPAARTYVTRMFTADEQQEQLAAALE